MALRVSVEAIAAPREAMPLANFRTWRRRDARPGAAAGAVSSVFEGAAFHISRSAPSVGAAASAALTTASAVTAVVVETTGAPCSLVSVALATIGNPAERKQTANPVRMERCKTAPSSTRTGLVDGFGRKNSP